MLAGSRPKQANWLTRYCLSDVESETRERGFRKAHSKAIKLIKSLKEIGTNGALRREPSVGWGLPLFLTTDARRSQRGVFILAPDLDWPARQAIYTTGDL